MKEAVAIPDRIEASAGSCSSRRWNLFDSAIAPAKIRSLIATAYLGLGSGMALSPPRGCPLLGGARRWASQQTDEVSNIAQSQDSEDASIRRYWTRRLPRKRGSQPMGRTWVKCRSGMVGLLTLRLPQFS